MQLAELLRQYRAEAHLSQEQLAERAGISARAIGDIETGVSRWPRAITVALIAEALELDARSREALRTASSRANARQTNASLPKAAPLVGRDSERAALNTLLRDPLARIVTVTGGPGVGKTALAAAAAGDVAAEFADGAFFIEFATLPDAALVPTRIALALGVREIRAESVSASIASAIGERAILLVLDNFERASAAAPVVAELVAATPHLKILATSRSRLHLSNERLINLEPLSPESSARLLGTRIGGANGADPDTAGMASLARALGGVPLAIELAAPLLRETTPAELAARLEHPLDVLVAMRDAIGYSYALLAPNERRVFRALAVFDGPFTEEGARAVAGSDDAGDLDTLRTLAALVDRSLIGANEDPSGEPEFGLHPLVSEFAATSLEGENESESAYLRMTEYCAALARMPPQPEPFADPATRARLHRESAHFDAALGWLRSTHRIERAILLAFELWPIWYRRGANAHGYAWVDSLLADSSAGTLDDAVRGDGHWAAMGLAEASGRFDDAERHGTIAIELRRAAGDRSAVARMLAGLSVCASAKGEYAAARRFLAESLAIRRELGDGLNVARALLDFGMLAADEGKFEEANAHLDEALVLFRAAGRRMGGSQTIGALALVAVRSGAAPAAESLAREALRTADEIGFKESARAAKIVLARALLELGELPEAEHLAREITADDAAASGPGADALRLLVAVEFRLGRAAEAARLAESAAGFAALPVIPLAERAAYESLLAAIAAAQFRE